CREERAVRDSRQRHALPGRDRRGQPEHAGQTPARFAGERGHARRRHAPDQGRRARARRHQPRPRSDGQGRTLPRRPLLSPGRDPARGAPPRPTRRDDIQVLMNYFLAKHGTPSRPMNISADARGLIMNYAWPGNVRQLESAIERALLLAEGDEITAEDLPVEI